MKLALGTAQFGLEYGVSNIAGRTPPQEVANILSVAKFSGIDTLDTAAAYGDSELVLGHIGVNEWCTVSKLPPLPQDFIDGEKWVRECVNQTLAKLQVSCLYGLLLHRAVDLLGTHRQSIAAGLQHVKAQGLVKKVGVSIYSPAPLAELIEIMPLDVVQAPFNVFDQRLVTSGWLERLADLGTEVHIRSVFLQGLLLMAPEKRPPAFDKWWKLWQQWDMAVGGSSEKALALCLGVAKARPEISRVIVGVENHVHLKQLLAIWEKVVPFDASELACNDPQLVEPSNWKLK